MLKVDAFFPSFFSAFLVVSVFHSLPGRQAEQEKKKKTGRVAKTVHCLLSKRKISLIPRARVIAKRSMVGGFWCVLVTT